MENKKPLLLNNRNEALSIEHLRSRKRFSTYSEAQLQHLLHTLKTFTHIVYRIWAKNKKAVKAQADLAQGKTTIISLKPESTIKQPTHHKHKAA